MLLFSKLMSEGNIDFKSKWYFGGLSAAAASIFTYPLSVIRVPMQVRRTKISLNHITQQIIKRHGYIGLYYGLSAHLMKHLSYSLLRFSIYDLTKEYLSSASTLDKTIAATVAGSLAGFIGTPSAKISTLMTNDLMLPKQKRRNYKHALDGLIQIFNTEGVKGLFTGGIVNTIRGAFSSIAQIAFYDELTHKFIRNGEDHNSMITHFEASLISGITGAIITEPLSVLRSRLMVDYNRGLKGMWEMIRFTAKYSHHKFYKGFVFTFLEVVPQTIITFMFMEQLRIKFGTPFEIQTTDEDPSSETK